jgi:hypothetical protein
VHPKREANPDAKRPKPRDRDMDRLVKMCWTQGWWCERGGTNHIKCYPPTDEGMVSVPSIPSGSRTYANLRSALRRRGLKG